MKARYIIVAAAVALASFACEKPSEELAPAVPRVDTLYMFHTDTVYSSRIDTLYVHDTVYVPVTDTIYITTVDTLYITPHDGRGSHEAYNINDTTELTWN